MATTTPTSDLTTALGIDPGIERLYDNVQAQVSGVGLEAIKLAAWNTIEDFCLQSTLLREHVYWRMVGGVQAIDLSPFDDSTIAAWTLGYTGLFRGKVEPPAVLRDLTFPTPTAERFGEAWLVLKPASFDAATACDAFPAFWSTWFEALLSGVLYRLYMQPAKPYSNPALALEYKRIYRRGIGEARGYAMRGFSGGGPVRSPYFARGRQ